MDFGKLPRIHCLVTLWVKNFDEITLSRTVKEIKIKCFAFSVKIRKFKMAGIFGERKFFFKTTKSTLLGYAVVLKFRRYRSISHGSGDRSKFGFLHFRRKFIMAAIFGEMFFFKLARVHCYLQYF